MKKVTLMIFLGLLTISGAGAYTFGSEGIENLLNDLQNSEDNGDTTNDIILDDEVKDLDVQILINTNYGINDYDMEEVDDGDNNEEEVVEEILYSFEFRAYLAEGNASSYYWDFGDGNSDEGMEITHQFTKPGKYEVTLKATNGLLDSEDKVEITVDFDGHTISDNMECTCAPTAKETTIDLKIEEGIQEFYGETTVTHDGSSEDCTQRNILQQCHLRVILEIYDGTSLVSDDILFDDTFDTNSITVNFSHKPTDENNYTYQLRLETDQLRDWHKPETVWFAKY